jgi:predicted peroxiredoxin
MKFTALLFMTGLLILSCNEVPKPIEDSAEEVDLPVVSEPARDGIFIHITEGYDDPHRVLMPLKMATMMAEDKDVLVYMDIHAVELLVKDAEDLNFADFESVQTYLKQLADKGVGVFACPTCLKVAGFQPADLRDGVQAAEKDKFFNFSEGRLLTLDY